MNVDSKIHPYIRPHTRYTANQSEANRGFRHSLTAIQKLSAVNLAFLRSCTHTLLQTIKYAVIRAGTQTFIPARPTPIRSSHLHSTNLPSSLSSEQPFNPSCWEVKWNMKNVKDLTPELVKAEAKDKFYMIQGKIVRLLAPQHYTRPFIYKKKGWGQIERVEITQDGTPQDLRAPKKRRRIRKGEEEVKIGDCWTFKVEKDTVMLPWGTHFGLFKKSLFRSLEAQRKLRYEAAPLGLMRVYPLWLPVGKTPCESMKEDRLPEVILETRHTQGGDVMVEAFFDYIEGRSFQCIVEVDSEAPINEEKIVALMKSLNTLDTIGPAKRGQLSIEMVVLVEPTEEELEKMSKGEPVGPVIY